MDGETLSDFLKESELCDDLFSILEALESGSDCNSYPVTPREEQSGDSSFEFQKPADSFQESEVEPEEAAAASPKYCKRREVMTGATTASPQKLYEAAAEEHGPQTRMTHIAVERNRRKQMNDHLSVLRSLMPCFYVKRGDQASIIGGVVNYITELQQLLQTLQAKKQRKAYADVMSPRPSPNPSPKPTLSPRMSLPVSPRTPQPSSPYKPLLHYHQQINPPSLVSSPIIEPSPCNSSSNTNDVVNELVASSKTAVAEVEVKFSGPNLLLRTVSHRIPGQAVKIISALEQQLQLQILNLKISTVDDTMLYCFTIKIGIECQLSAEDLAQRIQMTFC